MKSWNVSLLRCDPDSSNVYSSFRHPGLALPVIGTVLKNAGHRVKIHVDVIRKPSSTDLVSSDLIGLSVNSACFQESYRLADRVRGEGRCPVVFGGPHVTFLPEEALEHGDFVVRGEGEQTILELIRELSRERPDFGQISGLSWRDAGGVVRHNPDRELEEDLDLIPDQSLIVGYREFNRHWTQRLFPTGALVSTSRGCPFRCTFCTIPQTFGQRLRFRSHDAVIADIRQQLAFAGHRYVYFTDDNFTGHRRRVKELLRRIIDERLDIRFSAQLRADIVRDVELMDLLRRAGCYLVFVGFESINQATLDAYQKGIHSRAVLEQAIREFHRHRIMVHGMFVIGSDEDPPETALHTVDWAIEHRLDSLQLLPICPLPGTEVLARLDAEGRLYRAADPITRRSFIPYGAGSFVLHEPKNMSAVRLQRELMLAYRRFYSVRGIGSALFKLHRYGMEPLIYRLLGRGIVRRAESEVDRHVRWLGARRPESKSVVETT